MKRRAKRYSRLLKAHGIDPLSLHTKGAANTSDPPTPKTPRSKGPPKKNKVKTEDSPEKEETPSKKRKLSAVEEESEDEKSEIAFE